MGALLVLALVVVPLVEIFVLVQVGQLLGALPTVLLLLVMSVLGGLLLRREGARTYRAFRVATASGKVPGKEVADGALVIFGGALLLTPGFFTDVLGLVCVLPVTRPLVRRLLLRVVTARFGLVGLAAPMATGAFQRARGARRTTVVDGEVVDPPRGDPAP